MRQILQGVGRAAPATAGKRRMHSCRVAGTRGQRGDVSNSKQGQEPFNDKAMEGGGGRQTPGSNRGCLRFSPSRGEFVGWASVRFQFPSWQSGIGLLPPPPLMVKSANIMPPRRVTSVRLHYDSGRQCGKYVPLEWTCLSK